MVLQCCVPKCMSRSKKMKLFLAPYTKIPRWKEWCRICPFLTKLKPMQLQNARFCNLHFKPEHINEQNKLTADAVPTLNLPPTVSDLSNIDMSDLQTDNTVTSVSTPILTISDLQIQSQSRVSESIPGPILTISDLQIQSQTRVSESIPGPMLTISNLQIQSQTRVSESIPGPSGIPAPAHDISFSDYGDSCDLSSFEPIDNGSDKTELARAHSVQTTPVRTSKKPIHRRFQHRIQNASRVHLFPSDTTPRKQKLLNTKKILKAKLRFWEHKVKNFKKATISYPKTLQFIKKYKSLHAFGKLLVDSQLQLSDVSPTGRRYTSHEKTFAVSIFKRSEKCYAFMRKYITLPCKSRLNSLLADIPLRPGINDFIFQHLANASIGKSEVKKQCALLFDVMAVNNSIFFNFNTGVIEGLEDIGNGRRSSNVANRVLIFMLRGLFSEWKFPVAFYFVRDGIKTSQLKKLLREVVDAVSKSGFCIRATVSDQGSANVAAIKSLITDTRAELGHDEHRSDIIYYKINNIKIYHIFDVPHLLKCFRDDFQRKDLHIAGQQAQWSFVKMIYNMDGSEGQVRSTELTDKHVNPQGNDKMELQYAAQVFSNKLSTAVAVYMKTLLQLQQDYGFNIPVDIEKGFVTADLLQFINDLFDSLNCYGHSRRPYQQALRSNTAHFSFWHDAIKKLSSMRFNDPDENERNPPSLKNFVHDIKTVIHLWADLSKLDGVECLNLRRLNQDDLQIFFGQIRLHGGNTNLDCSHFVSAYKTLLVNNISSGKSLYTNCSSDDDTMLGMLKNFAQYRNSIKSSSLHGFDSDIYANNCELINNTIPDTVPEGNVLQSQSVSYIACAICRDLLPKLPSNDCGFCKNALLSDSTDTGHREYCTDRQSFHPSINLSSLVSESIHTIEKFLPKIYNVYVYSELISALEKNTNTSWFTCTIHKKHFFAAFWLYVIRMQVRQWCINFNIIVHNIETEGSRN